MGTWSAGLRFHENVHGVYFDDLDALGILHNARYLLLVERTIGSFWARLGFGGNLAMQSGGDQFHLVRKNTIEYLRPVISTGEVRTRVWIDALGRTSLTFGFAVLPMDQDVDFATGSRVIVCVDPKTRVSRPWGAAFRAEVAPFVRPQ